MEQVKAKFYKMVAL